MKKLIVLLVSIALVVSVLAVPCFSEEVNVTWPASKPDPMGYNVFMKATGSNDDVKVATVAAPANQATIDVVVNTEYTVTVEAFDGCGNTSARSEALILCRGQGTDNPPGKPSIVE